MKKVGSLFICVLVIFSFNIRASASSQVQAVIPATAEERKASEIKAAEMSRVAELLGLGHQEKNLDPAKRFVTSKTLTNVEINEVNAILSKYNAPNSSISALSEIGILRQFRPFFKLYFTPVAQLNGYYCGPASAYMVLKQQGANVTQTGLAGSSYLQTDSSGTSFGSNWTTTMNAYSDHNYSILWGDSYDSIDRAILMTDSAIVTLASGFGVIYDTIQYNNQSARLVGYPSYLPNTIYHYVAGEGYNTSDSSNRVCYYVDPNGSNSDAYGSREIGFRLMCTLIKDRGLVF